MEPSTGKVPISTLCILSMFLIFLFSGSGFGQFNEAERDSLVKLKETLDPEHKTKIHGNWTALHCYENVSQWIGIRCLNWRATYLVLEGIGLPGSIPRDAFVNLTELRTISLRNNNLSGPLPDIGGLRLLKNVYFSGNKFFGSILDNFSMQNMRRLKLSDNNLSGPIPASLTGLRHLKELYLQNNELAGSIPPFDYPDLKGFNVSNNKLTGAIPDTPVLNSFNESSYSGNDFDCGIPMNMTCPPDPVPRPATPDSASLNKYGLSLGIACIVLVIF